MTTLEVIAQLIDALEAAQATGALVRDTESGALFTFRVSPTEYAAATGEEAVDVDDADGSVWRSKTVYRSDAEQFPEYAVVVVPPPPHPGGPGGAA